MQKITLIWTSPYRIMHVRKHLVYGLLGGAVFLFLASLIFSFWVFGNYGKLKSMEGDYAELRDSLKNPAGDLVRMLHAKEMDLASSRQELQEREAALQELVLEMEKTRQELFEIRGMEIKIRRFLGLKVPPDEDLAHQGGYEDLSVDFRSGAFKEIYPAVLTQPTLCTSSLRSGLEEVLEQLEKRRVNFLKVPSILPVQGEELWISSGFGWRRNPFGRGQEFHNGLDVAGKLGTPIIAPADGTVSDAGNERAMGNYVRLEHSDKVETVYLHLQSIKVKKGDPVKQGDTIGLMGNTGRSTGTHLHYSVIVNGKHVDPINYIWDRSSTLMSLAERY